MPHDPSTNTRAAAPESDATRQRLIASLYQQHASTVLRLVRGRVRADRASIEDVCQTAWLRLCTHPEVDLAAPGAAIGWLVVTATREAWRLARARAIPAGAMIGDTGDAGELAEPADTTHADPLEVAIDHEHHRERRALLLTLTARERQFLGLQGAGLSYQEIAALSGASRRTVERQILRARGKLARG